MRHDENQHVHKLPVHVLEVNVPKDKKDHAQCFAILNSQHKHLHALCKPHMGMAVFYTIQTCFCVCSSIQFKYVHSLNLIRQKHITTVSITQT